MESRSGLEFEVGGDFDFTQNKNEYPHYFKFPQPLFYAGVRSENGRLWDLSTYSGILGCGTFYLMVERNQGFAAKDVTAHTEEIYRQLYQPLELL